MKLPATSARVPEHSASLDNARIARATRSSIEYYQHHPEQIPERLRELEREWDVERTLESNASSLILIGLGLGALVNRKFLFLPLAVSGFLLQHALQGWCPPLPLLRRLGVRTQAEIAEERCALLAIGEGSPTTQ